MDWAEVASSLPQDEGSAFRARMLAHLRDRTTFMPEAVLKKVVVLADAQGRRMLWGIGSTGIQNLYLGADVAQLLPPELLRSLPTKLHSARRTYLDAYEGPAMELRRPEDLVMLDAFSGDPFDAALARWIGRVQTQFPGWHGFNPPDPAFEADERAYKIAAAEKLRAGLAAAQEDAGRLEALTAALAATNLLQWRVYWSISAKGDADHAEMAQAVTALISAAGDPQRHPKAVADFIASWVQHCPDPQRDGARQVAEYALMLLNPDHALLLRRGLLDTLYFEATGTRFPRGEAEAEYRAEIAFALRISRALEALGLAPRDMIDVQSLLWVAYRSEEARAQDLPPPEPQTLTARETAVTDALNTILYGPPGTGKTYATLRHAVGICDGEAAAALPLDALRARYEALREAGRIAFVTFHQSFSYEDFVEGLRPMTDEGGAGFRLVPTPGILRRMADLAEKGRSAVSGGSDIGTRGVFKISLGRQGSEEDVGLFDECIEGGYILLGSGGRIDWSDPEYATWGGIFKRWKQDEPDVSSQNRNVISAWSFRDDLKIGDILILTSGTSRMRAIGEVTGPYEYIERGEGEGFPHRRAVQWRWHDAAGLPTETVIEGGLATLSIHRIPPAKVKRDALAAYLAPSSGERLPHVLVIDEINRANVSKVFGELITLLEEDKRAGEENAVTLRLPYSGETFSLPSNLHILGTMNTADCSIALLDTALRRRFQFIEMPPRPELLGQVQALDLGLLLSRLNERIEYLYDRDHLIGHAFFIAAKTRAAVDQVMRRKVLPLLAEYFHEDWERIIAVLGGQSQGFIERIALTPPPGLEAVSDEPRWRYLVRSTFPDDAYAGLQM